VTVSDFRCQSIDQVANSLTANGLAIGNIIPNDPGPTWVVVDQRPSSGSQVPVGTAVDLKLGDPKKSGCPGH
jgi:beta-lactam-binding protein with PASTA domain